MIRAYLENKGVPIGPFDTQIAAQGLAGNLTVVTNNVREFSRIPGLKVEDWTKEKSTTPTRHVSIAQCFALYVL